MNTNDKESDTSLTLVGGLHILPEGGLKVFREISGEECPFDDEESLEEIWNKFNPQTANDVISLFLQVKTFSNNRRSLEFLALGLRKKIISGENLINLYMMQDVEIRQHNPIITLHDLWNIQYMSDNRHDSERRNVPMVRIFQPADIIGLANKFIKISPNDIEIFFRGKGWFYQETGPLSFSEEFLLYWYEEATRWNHNGKLRSLIAWAIHTTYPNKLDLKDTIEKFVVLSTEDPHSHGIHRYMGLCFAIAGEDKEKRGLVLDACADSVINQFKKGSSYIYYSRFFVLQFLGFEDVTKEEKEKFLKKIHGECLEMAQKYVDAIPDLRKEAGFE